MSKEKGWICLYRKIQDCFLWTEEEPFDRRSAWIDLLLLANHEDKKMLFDGKTITVGRGQRITSVRNLAKRWHWGNARTLNFLRMLEEEQMIVKQSDNRRTLVTIVNYSVYNDIANTDGTLTERSQNTDGTLSEHSPTTNNNDNNDKNNENNDNNNNPPNPPKGKKGKKESCVELFERLIQASPNVLSDEVISVLHEWMEYKDQKKEKYVEGGMKPLLNKIYKAQKKYGSDAVVNCVLDSMASNYKGIILDKLDSTQSMKVTNQQRTKDILARAKKKAEEEEAGEEE